MSRVGRKPIKIPDRVDVTLEGDQVTVSGPKGQLTQSLPGEMTIAIEGDTITVTRPADDKRMRSLHGLTRSLIDNMIQGVTGGFQKKLEIVGVGYRATKKGSGLQLELGYSHPIELDPPEGIKVELEGRDTIVVEGIDKQLVGDFAAHIRAYRKPEPYKGKGIKYKDEVIRRKVGKTG